MANQLVAFRFPQEILSSVNTLAKEKGTNRTAIATEALRLGLAVLQSREAVIQHNRTLSVEDIEKIVDRRLEEKLEKLRKL